MTLYILGWEGSNPSVAAGNFLKGKSISQKSVENIMLNISGLPRVGQWEGPAQGAGN